jgi:hypothetical protein
MGKYEKDDARPRRRNEEDDGDAKNKRELGERTRWGARSGKDEFDVREDEDAGKAGARRDREKFQQPWLRGARIPESNDDSRRDERKPPDWRRGDRSEGRAWDRNDRLEAEPEWMDAGDDDDDPLQSKTMQDFEQWKQRMKTGGGAAPEAKPQPKMEELPPVEEKPLKARVTTRSEQDDAMDKFYASFGAQKIDAVKQEAPVKAPTKSRFANMFGAPADVPAKLPTPPLPAAPPQPEQMQRPPSNAQATPLGNADQEGFQRILQMLQTRSNSGTPPTQRPGSSRTSTQRTDPAPRAQDTQQRPIMEGSGVKSPQEDQSRRAKESMLEGLLNIRSPPVQTHQRQESENPDERQLLLQLLGQADTREQKRSQMRSADPRQMPGLQTAYSNMNQQASAYNQQLAAGSNSRQHIQQERPPSFFDEPQLFNTAEPNQLPRRPTNEQALPAFFDEAAYRHSLRSLRQNAQQGSTSESMQGPPPGLGRPPGFDQMRNIQGFPAQQQLQSQPRQAGPPPGIPNLPMQQRGLPAQFQPPMPIPGQSQQQAPPRRKYTGEGPGFPPGMRPPPGFMQNGPPPDYAAMAQYARYQNEQQGLPRDLHDSRYGTGRASGMPGAYR